MIWNIKYLPEAEKELDELEGSQRQIVIKAIRKVKQNPLPASEGGYGKPLGNHSRTNLVGCLKIKIVSCGIRVVYKLERKDNFMNIIVIGARADDEVYEIAHERIKKQSLTM